MAHRRRRRRSSHRFGPTAPASTTGSDDGNVSEPDAQSASQDNEGDNGDDNQGDE